jgi:drug/metabolite transporter (DMT)-like permease
MDAREVPMNIRIVLSFLAIYLIWGSTFTAIKWGLESFPPFMLSGLRFLMAGIIFFAVSRIRDFKTIKVPQIRREMLIGIFLTIGNAGVCWAEQFISSGVAALIVGAVPVMFILFNWLSFEKKVPTTSAMIGFAVGMTGIMLISMDSATAVDWRGVVALIIANCSWVIGSLMMRTTVTTIPYFPRASIQLVTGGLFNLLLSTFMGESLLSFEKIEMKGILSVAYLALAGTILAYTCYSYLMRTVKTELASTYALVNPILAVLLGVIWLNEPFTMKIAIAATLIIGSVFLVIYGEKLVPVKVKK